MTDSAIDFFVNEVDPAVRMFMQDYGSVWKGRCAAMMLTHAADHVWHARPCDRAGTAKEDEFRAHLARLHPAYELLCDVTNASKHAVLSVKKPHRRQPLISRADQVARVQLGWGEAGYGQSRWGGPAQVYVTLTDGSVCALDAAAKRVHAMWCEMLGLSLAPLE